MAIQVSTNLDVNKGSLACRRTANATIELTGSKYKGGVHIAGTVTTTIDVTELDSTGYAFFRNLSDEATIKISDETIESGGSGLIELLPTQFGLVPIGVNELYVQADDDDIELEFVIFEK